MNRRPIRHWLVLAAILTAAALLRLPGLDRVPPGLWYDEALNGQDALEIWHAGGGFRLLYPDVFPREPFFETLLGLAVGLGGPRIPVLRIVPVALGLATVALMFFAVRRLWGPRLALTAAAVLATMRWHAIFSRLVFRTIALPMWLLLVLWCAVGLRRRPSLWRAALLGATIGGGFYTYLAWYFMLPWVGVLAFWAAGVRLGSWQRPWRIRAAGGWARVLHHGTAIALAACVVAAPLGLHYVRHPEHLFARPGAVSPLRGGAGAAAAEIAENTAEAALMFHWRGDHVPKHNLPHRPALDPLQGLAMLLGMTLAVRAVTRRRAVGRLPLLWLGCGLLPTVLTQTDSPNFLRTLCVTPAVALLVAWGLVALTDALRRRIGARTAAVVLCFAVAFSGVLSAWDIYGRWARDPQVWESFNGPYADLGRHAAALDPEAPCYLPGRLLRDSRTLQFLTHGRERIRGYDDFDFLLSAPFATADADRRRLVVATAHNRLLGALERLFPGGGVVHELRTPSGGAWAVVYAVPPRASADAALVTALQDRWPVPIDF